MTRPDLDLLDTLLEQLTVALVQLTSGDPSVDLVAVGRDAGWYVQFLGEPETLRMDIITLHEDASQADLDDYQLALVYSLGLEEPEDALPIVRFGQEWELDEGDRWEEQTLREFALEALGLLTYILLEDPADLHVEAAPVPPSEDS